MTTAPVALHGKKRVKIKEYAHKAAMPMRKESENNNTTIQSFNDGREIKGERSGAQCQGYNGDHDAWCTNNVNSNVRSTKNTNDFSIGIHDLEDPGLILKILYQIVAALCLFMVVWTLLIPGSWMFGRSRIHDVVAGGYLVYLGKRGLVPPEFFTKYRGHTAIHLTHLLPSAAWSALIPLQLHTSVRRQHPRLHRHLGYLFFSSSILVAVGLCIILQRGLLFEWSFTDLPPPRISFQPLVMMDLIYFTGTALYALQLAVSRQFTLHRNWVIRHVASGLFIALQRLLIAILFGPFHPPPVSRSSQRTIFGQAGFLAFLISVLCGEYAIHLLNLKQLHVRNKGLCSHQDETAGVSERDLHEEIQKQTEITIHPLGGKSFKMIVCPNDRISAVKRDIELLTKHPSAMQNLIYRNKRLQDECTLGSYGVERGSVIHQRLKIKGGGTKQGTNKEFKFISSRFSRQLARMPRDHPDVIHNTTSDGNDGNSNSQDVDPVAAAQTLPAIDELFMSVPKRMNKRSWIICLSLASFLPLLQNFRVLLSSKGASIFDMTLEFHRKAQFDVPTHLTYQQKRKTTVAYAVSVTGYKEGSTNLLDRAAVLHQSIKLAMQQSARYDFHIYAFVHPDAEPAADKFKQLGYRVQIRDTPFNLSDVPNPEFVAAQKSGCCGEKEYLKLYSWLLLDYPAVIHLDLDTLVLKPMDDLFDLLSDPGYNRKNFQSSAMWTNMEEYDGGVDFLFTRDYYMVHPPYHQPHQVGVQGGFLAVRPDGDIFSKFVHTIVHNNNFESTRWGGKALGYGKYYGAATIQGLASYFYGHLEPNRSVELNRCYYNTMVDEPYDFNPELNETLCTTVEPNLTCQDCRETSINEIYTAHFTSSCGKPEKCYLEHETPLCMKLFMEWHRVRLSLEKEWMAKYNDYKPNILMAINGTSSLSNGKKKIIQQLGGHCSGQGSKSYLPLRLPSDIHVMKQKHELT